MCSVIEYAKHGDLRKLIIDKCPLPEAEAKLVIRQIAEGLAAIHQAGVIHRDLKTENMVCAEDGSIKIIDFGCAVLNPLHRKKVVERFGTIVMIPPEVWKNQPIDQQVDMWALGLICYEIVAGFHPYERPQANAFTDFSKEARPPLPINLSKAFVRMVDGLLNVDPDQRLTAEQLLKQKWL